MATTSQATEFARPPNEAIVTETVSNPGSGDVRRAGAAAHRATTGRSCAVVAERVSPIARRLTAAGIVVHLGVHPAIGSNGGISPMDRHAEQSG
jgi:hypothetical protein